jgi:hypothetical protein
MELVVKEANEFVVLWSPATVEHGADYCELGRFPSEAEAKAFLTAEQSRT